MIKPIADLILTPEQSRYSLVIAIAKRARQIAEDAEKNKVILDDKPVQIAVREYMDHKFKMIEKVSPNDDSDD
ncbi:MAG: DNA-directed RNA polymerase subunit omega [Oscillospiraceae bacterium]|jgi:DNA-directed RNA polymerase subunit omega|nr:DNA-directed RNA polymerase subunit omega [Oscillospiraceae bacterium]MCI1990822.1 DNA-directed RNA polymerase subunit omega [Oscillospiraceae bacterium]MCI2035353.1 DNA-directed RNA polymerase subunit omega [Oscillospiraceae bacterium]